MAVNRRALRRVMEQKASTGKVVDARTQALVVAWARAWDEVAADLQDALVDYVETSNVSSLVRARKARQALQVVSQRLDRLARTAGVQISADALRLIRQAARDSHDLILAQLPTSWDKLLRTDPTQLDRIAQRTTETIHKRTYLLQTEAQVAMKRELLRGVATGINPREAARRMVDRVHGHFNGGLTRAMVIARTEMLDAYRNAAQATQNANRNVLQQWQWVATLSHRTCPSCLAQHGSLHDLDEPGPLDHHQGRCARVPVTKSWRELGFDIDEPEPAIRPGDGVRWFENQPEGTQRGILGPSRYDAYTSGGFPASDWSERRRNGDWRDSFGVGRPRTSNALAS